MKLFLPIFFSNRCHSNGARFFGLKYVDNVSALLPPSVTRPILLSAFKIQISFKANNFH